MNNELIKQQKQLIEDSNLKYEELQNFYQNLQEKNQQTHAQTLKSYESQIEQIKQEMSLRQEQSLQLIADLKKNLRESQLQSGWQKEEIEALKDRLAAANGKSDEAAQQLQRKQEALAQLEASASSDKAALIQKELEARQSNELLQKQMDDLRREMQAKQKEHDSGITKLLNQLKVMQSASDLKTQQAQAQEEQLRSILQSKDNLVKQLDAKSQGLSEELVRLRTEKLELEAKIKESELRAAQLAQEQKQLLHQMEESEAKVLQLQQAVESGAAQKLESQGLINGLKQQIKDLQQQADQQLSKAKEDNLLLRSSGEQISQQL